MNKRFYLIGMIFISVLALSACGQSQASPGTGTGTANHVTSSAGTLTSHGAGSQPHGVMSAGQACRQVIGTARPGFFTRPDQVHLVLTTYSKGEPVESEGDINSGMPPKTMVWVVEVHAKAIHWDHSMPPGSKTPPKPDTDFSVVLNARTGYVSDEGECTCWPLPLSLVGTVVRLSPKC